MVQDHGQHKLITNALYSVILKCNLDFKGSEGVVGLTRMVRENGTSLLALAIAQRVVKLKNDDDKYARGDVPVKLMEDKTMPLLNVSGERKESMMFFPRTIKTKQHQNRTEDHRPSYAAGNGDRKPYEGSKLYVPSVIAILKQVLCPPRMQLTGDRELAIWPGTLRYVPVTTNNSNTTNTQHNKQQQQLTTTITTTSTTTIQQTTIISREGCLSAELKAHLKECTKFITMIVVIKWEYRAPSKVYAVGNAGANQTTFVADKGFIRTKFPHPGEAPQGIVLSQKKDGAFPELSRRRVSYSRESHLRFRLSPIDGFEKERPLFFGLAGFYRGFIDGFQKRFANQDYAYSKEGSSFVWGDKQEAAFQLLKQKLCSAPILALPEGSKDFIAYCDASKKGFGDVLMQREKHGNQITSRVRMLEVMLIENAKFQRQFGTGKVYDPVGWKPMLNGTELVYLVYGDLRM
ncbi:putative reverse transcriptase domain-containing protein [Tanacetum coccineum]